MRGSVGQSAQSGQSTHSSSYHLGHWRRGAHPVLPTNAEYVERAATSSVELPSDLYLTTGQIRVRPHARFFPRASSSSTASRTNCSRAPLLADSSFGTSKHTRTTAQHSTVLAQCTRNPRYTSINLSIDELRDA